MLGWIIFTSWGDELLFMDEKRNGGEISSYLRTCSVHLHQELIAIFLIDHVNIYADVGIIACIPCKKLCQI